MHLTYKHQMTSTAGQCMAGKWNVSMEPLSFPLAVVGVGKADGEGWRRHRRDSLALAKPLSLHVLVLPPGSHMHIVLFHALLGSLTQDLDQASQPLCLAHKHVRKPVDEPLVLRAGSSHLEFGSEVQLDHHSHTHLLAA